MKPIPEKKFGFEARFLHVTMHSIKFDEEGGAFLIISGIYG
jgi:hypothetical protein